MRLRDVSRILHHDLRKKAADQSVSLHKTEASVESDWDSGAVKPPKSRYLWYLVLATFLFFLTTVAVAFFVRIAGIDKTVSTDKITILTQGPVVADGGAAVPLSLRVANGNPVAIRDATFSIMYPSGTYVEDGDVRHLRREEYVFGTVQPGEVTNMKITPVFYGTAGERKELQYELEYRIDGSSQPIKIIETYEILLRTAPLSLSGPQYTNPVAGKEITFTVSVRSNMPDILPLAYLRMEYPDGFVPFSASPEQEEGGGGIWKLRALRPGEKRTLRMRGVIRNPERTEQAVLARAFVAPTGTFEESVAVAEEHTIFAVEKPFLDVALSLNGDTDDTVVSPGDSVRGVLRWKNSDSAPLQNLVFTVSLEGTGLDESSIEPGEGRFEEVEKHLVWDTRQVRSLSSVNAGESGEFHFRFSALPDRVEFAQAEKYMRFGVSVSAYRTGTGAAEVIDNLIIREARLRSALHLAANTLYSSSVIRNSGPVPPRVGEKTTYALQYTVKNSGNELSGITVTVPLSPAVSFSGVVAGLRPEEWIYDSEANVITVEIPSLPAFGIHSAKSMEFQVIIEPRERDRGEELPLTQRASYRAYDTYVTETFKGEIGGLTTYITAEPRGRNDAVVAE